MYQHYEGSLLPYYTRWEALPIVMKYQGADLLPVVSQLGEHEGLFTE